jgi:biofilm PGA synthesis protein PgaA
MADRQDVMQLGHRWEQHNKHQYRIDSSFGDSSGVQLGSRHYRIDGHYFVKPLAYRLRPFVHTSDAFAEFPEGDATRRRLGVGIEYRAAAWLGSLELNNDRSGGATGVDGSLDWFISDVWSLAASWETQSDEVPLRGHRVGVDANRVGLRLGYRASESRQISVSGGRLQLSDGNTRRNWLVQARQRVVTRPAYKLDLDAEIFASTGSAQDVAYFNPRRDASALVTAINEWRTYRRYDFAFTQQFNFGFGYYEQDSLGTSPIHFLQYIANIDVNEGLSVRFGVRRSRNVYDGNAEDATLFTLDMAGWF